MEGVRIKDAGNCNFRIAGKITLTVMLGHRVESISFYSVERLTTQVILGCDFCDKHVEAIKPRQRFVEMDDGTTVPILRTSVRKSNAVRLPPEQEFFPKKRRQSTRLAVAEAVVLQPSTQTWVKVNSERSGLVMIEPDKGLFAKHNCCLLYTSPSPRDQRGSRMPSSA